MRTVWRDYIPDEWQSAAAAARDIRELVSRTTHAWFKVVVGVGVPYAVGISLAILVVPAVSGDFVTAAIAVLGILSGFLMSLMLFTGRLAGSEALTFEQAQQFRDKVLYLLWSESVTLLNYVMTLGLAALWYIATGSGAGSIPFIVEVLFLGGLFVSVLRSAALPYQVIEMHAFSLNALVDSKRREREERLRQEMRDLE